MSDSNWPSQLVKFGYESQQRFDYYALALTFTILGLAIQSATFGFNHVAAFFELASWVLLLASGLAGMARVAWEPKVYQYMGLLAGQEDRISTLKTAKVRGTAVVYALDTGTDLDIDGMIVRDQRDQAKIDEALKRVQAKAQWGYRLRSIAFLAGIVCLAVARGLTPFLGLLAAWRAAT